jgi:hypothetical protein
MDMKRYMLICLFISMLVRKGKNEVVKLGNEVIVFGIVQGGPYNKV